MESFITEQQEGANGTAAATASSMDSTNKPVPQLDLDTESTLNREQNVSLASGSKLQIASNDEINAQEE